MTFVTHKPDNFEALLLAQGTQGNCPVITKQVLELIKEAGFAWASPRINQAGLRADSRGRPGVTVVTPEPSSFCAPALASVHA